MMKFLCLTLLSVWMIASGCSGNNGSGDGDEKIRTFEKITDHNLTLKVISTRGSYYIAEGAPTMRFQFRNDGINHIELPEWKARERENIRIFYALCPKRGESGKIPESEWKESPRIVASGDCPRYPLSLDPKNSIIMEIPLFFIGKLDEGGLYAVRAELDLTSVDVKSEPVEIWVK